MALVNRTTLTKRYPETHNHFLRVRTETFVFEFTVNVAEVSMLHNTHIDSDNFTCRAAVEIDDDTADEIIDTLYDAGYSKQVEYIENDIDLNVPF